MLPPDAIFKIKIHKNAFAAGASLDPKITELPRPPSLFSGSRFAAREGKGGGEGREGGKGKGLAFLHFFLQFNYCSALSSV